MVDSTFFSKKKSFTLAELAEIGHCEIFPQNTDKDIIINDVGSIYNAKHGEITFVTNLYGKYQEYLGKTQASACIVDKKFLEKLQMEIPLLVSSNPYKSYALIAQSFYPREEIEAAISPQASIDPSAKIGKECRIEDFARIGKNACIGHNTIIESNVYIGPNVVIGDNCIIKANSVIQYSLIGNNVIIHPGVKIGQDGFGFASDREGHTLVPQLGRVIICDDVNIGANSCIDRGALNDTIIGKGTQIDNLVQIGHNVEIGMNCIIVSQVGIAGSTKIGDFVVIGGQVGIAGHLNIGSGAQIAAKSGVTKDVEPGKKISGMPAISLYDWKKQVLILKNLIKNKE